MAINVVILNAVKDPCICLSPGTTAKGGIETSCTDRVPHSCSLIA